MSINSTSGSHGRAPPGHPLPQSSSVGPLPPGSKSDLWRRLRFEANGTPGPFINPNDIGDRLGVVCPVGTAVPVKTENARVPIHANFIKFVRKCMSRGANRTASTVETIHIAKAGQSPQRSALCEKFLVEGLDSGQGLFQFVSRKAHAASIGMTKEKSKEHPIIDQLLDAWENCGEQPGRLHLAGRFTVTGVERQPSQGNHRRVMLTVQDIADTNKTITIPVTQAGLKFTGRLLQWKDIETANTLLEEHRKCVDALVPDGALPADDPMILSFAGIGRNAALITYRETMARIKAEPDTAYLGEQWLDDTLVEIVTSGRRDRGPGFMHSDVQLQELRTGFTEVLERRDPSASLAQSPVQPVGSKRWLQFLNPFEAKRLRAMSHPTDDLTIGTIVSVPRATALRREDLLHFLDEHRSDTPLQLLEALVKLTSPEVAAFCAAQVERAITPAQSNPVTPNSPMVASLHPAVQIDRHSHSRSEHRKLYAKQGHKFAVGSTGAYTGLLLTDILRHDLQQKLRPDGTLKQGARAGQPKLTVQQLTDLVGSSDTTSFDLTTGLAANNPACATFFSFMSHALLVKDSMTATPVERYPYVADEALPSEKIESSGEPFLPTFLDGVQRHYDPFNSDNASWRIHTDGAWQDGQDTRDVLNHVFLQAIQHLHASAPTTPDMPIYPLVAYELLADAIGVPVPPYLVEHEQGILSTLTENRLRNEQREEQIATQQQRDRMEKQRGEIELQRHYAANDVSNSGQFHLAITGYQRSLADASVDIQLAPPADIGHAVLVADWSGRLALTHDKQEISARTHGAQPDNLCWSRSSWLSVFAMMSPAQLEAKLSTICDVSTYSAADAPILRAIAQAYQENPTAFLQGLHASAGDAPLSVDAVRQRSAHLGPNLPLAELLSVQPGAAGQSLKIHRTPEGFLQQLQCEIATAFRPPVTSDRSFMDEIESLQLPGIPASSNLPVTLHRALGLPVLVIETGSTVSHGEAGEQINQSAQMRVSAPNGSELATLAELLADTSGTPDMAGSTLLDLFSDLPVIWLNNDHYSVYLPKASPEETREAVMRGIRPVEEPPGTEHPYL